jgi:hypothetical protein
MIGAVDRAVAPVARARHVADEVQEARMSGLRRVRRFLVLLALGFGASLLLIEGVALHREYRAALARTSASALDLSRIVEEYARRSFETSDLLTEAISDRVRAAGGVAALRDNPAAHAMLREMAGRWSGDYLTVFDTTGVAVASSMMPDLPQVTVADRPWSRRIWPAPSAMWGRPWSAGFPARSCSPTAGRCGGRTARWTASPRWRSIPASSSASASARRPPAAPSWRCARWTAGPSPGPA